MGIKIAVITVDDKVSKELSKEFSNDYQVTIFDSPQKIITDLQKQLFDVLILKHYPYLLTKDIVTLVSTAKQQAPTSLVVLLSDQELPNLPQHILALIDASLSDCNLLSTSDFCKYLKKLIRKNNVSAYKIAKSVGDDSTYQNQYHPTSLIGHTLDEYHILEHLGGSDITSVYKAINIKSDQVVALKFLNTDVEDDLIKKRFTREGTLVARLKHPNINSVYNIKETTNGKLFIVMHYIKGHTLEEYLNHRSLPLTKILNYALQIAKGLNYAHEQGIIHRDIKPSNIMITSEDNIKLLDFGVAKRSLENSTYQSLTQQGSLLGTVAYMSPEQLLGKKVSEYTDCWAFGLLLYIMTTGEHPFMSSTKNALTLIEAILERKPLPPNLYSSVPNKLDTLITQLLCKEPYQARPRMPEVIGKLQNIQ